MMADKCPWCEHPIEYTPESDDLASRLNLAEERLHGVEGENQRLRAREAELEGAMIAIIHEFSTNQEDDMAAFRMWRIARAAQGE